MFDFTLLQQNAITGLLSSKSVRCAGYWVEKNPSTNAVGFIETDPMHDASLYKESDY